jgi:PBP superfamily domain
MLQLNPATGEREPSSATHHIAYLAPSWIAKYNAPLVSIQNNAGQFVAPTSAGVLTAIEQAGTVDPKTNLITLDFSKITDPAAYPIPMVEYLAVPTTGLSTAKAKALAAFVKYVLSDAGQKDVADTGYVPVSQETRTAGLKVAAALAATSSAQGGTTTTTTTAGTKTGSTTSTTDATTGTVGAAGDPTGGLSDGSSSGSGSGGGTALPFTGGPSPLVVVVAVFVGLVAVVGRRRARRARV